MYFIKQNIEMIQVIIAQLNIKIQLCFTAYNLLEKTV
ncbi:hypothetical protein DFQ03_1316 [Maribacter caenipelagi]|uniref:Uncharacterized protein n=1 Tax=Maribacter caenipelagi TaxID=1447781 RepID=A0A4V3E2D8_9FLAO|nr:hypothetical protein DFQ03_1316 [Maribacter caenipelagi]